MFRGGGGGGGGVLPEVEQEELGVRTDVLFKISDEAPGQTEQVVVHAPFELRRGAGGACEKGEPASFDGGGGRRGGRTHSSWVSLSARHMNPGAPSLFPDAMRRCRRSGVKHLLDGCLCEDFFALAKLFSSQNGFRI